MRKLDLTGRRFGRLTALHTVRRGKLRWLCSCDCGLQTEVVTAKLTSGWTQSCGCLQRERTTQAKTTHGFTDHRMYGVWQAMLSRCTLPTNMAYAHYGGRGIGVCERWKDFASFYADIGDPPFHGASIDRCDNNADYSPDNWRWATRSEQSRNRRKARVITHNGKTLHLLDWAELLGVSAKTLSSRIYQRHWPLDRALRKE